MSVPISFTALAMNATVTNLAKVNDVLLLTVPWSLAVPGPLDPSFTHNFPSPTALAGLYAVLEVFCTRGILAFNLDPWHIIVATAILCGTALACHPAYLRQRCLRAADAARRSRALDSPSAPKFPDAAEKDALPTSSRPAPPPLDPGPLPFRVVAVLWACPLLLSAAMNAALLLCAVETQPPIPGPEPAGAAMRIRHGMAVAFLLFAFAGAVCAGVAGWRRRRRRGASRSRGSEEGGVGGRQEDGVWKVWGAHVATLVLCAAMRMGLRKLAGLDPGFVFWERGRQGAQAMMGDALGEWFYGIDPGVRSWIGFVGGMVYTYLPFWLMCSGRSL